MMASELDDYVFIHDGQLFNLPFIPRGANNCTCECDGENELCTFSTESRCLACVMWCPGVKVHGPPPSLVERCLEDMALGYRRQGGESLLAAPTSPSGPSRASCASM